MPLIAIPNIGLYSAIAATATLLVGIFSLVSTHTEDVNEHARVVFLTILGLVAVVVYDTGPLGSPFLALWGAVSLAAPLFGLWGILPAALLAVGIPLFLAFTGHFEYTTAWYAMACAIIPLIFGLFLRPKGNTNAETKEDRSYHALAKELRRRGFRFVGPTTMFALMEAVGIVDTHLVDSHRRGTSGVWRQDGSRA